jgi:hypothetical protein
MQTRANQLHTSPTHWASRPGWGGGKNSTSNLLVLGGFAFWVLNLLASGLRELQSDGGNATRQNLGLGWTNCTATSATPACPGLLSAPSDDFFTRQNVTERQVLARLTGSRSRMSAPWALTTSVLVRSENAVPSAFWPCTMIPAQRKMRGLRLWLGVFPGRVLGVLMESGMHGRSQMSLQNGLVALHLVSMSRVGLWPVRRSPCRRVSAASSSL